MPKADYDHDHHGYVGEYPQIILCEARPAITLDDALLSMGIFPNGCDFRLRFEGKRTFLEYGCYGVHRNLTQGKTRLLMDWLGEAQERELPINVRPETIMELRARRPCQVCGGFQIAQG